MFETLLYLPFQSEEWPLNWFCEEMFRNLFNPSWEVRQTGTRSGTCSSLPCVLMISNAAKVSIYQYTSLSPITYYKDMSGVFNPTYVYFCAVLPTLSTRNSTLVYTILGMVLLSTYISLSLPPVVPGPSRSSHSSERGHQVPWRHRRSHCPPQP